MEYQPITVPLRKPLKHGQKEITELVFGRELVAGDMRGIPVADMCFDHILTAASRIIGLPPSVLAQMNGKDFSAVSRIVMGFLGDGPETGLPG